MDRRFDCDDEACDFVQPGINQRPCATGSASQPARSTKAVMDRATGKLAILTGYQAPRHTPLQDNVRAHQAVPITTWMVIGPL